jgi:hypothetical protein
VRRIALLVCAVPLVGLVLLGPVGAAEEQVDPAPESATDRFGGFHGFGSFETHAQGQVAELTGFLNTFREDTRLVGAVSEINGPTANSINIAAFVQRGIAGTFVYGVIGGPGGARGTLPDPPPGEANAYYPTDPKEMTVSGPVTAAAGGQVVDSRFHAKATEHPTGRAEGAITKLVSEGFSVEQATVVSHTEPVKDGVQAESVSVLRQVVVGPLVIQSLVSRALAFIPAEGGAPVGIASTVIEGAKVNDTPVQITDKGIVVGENASPLNQGQVNAAMAQAGFPQVRLIPSVAQPGDDGASVLADAGVLEFAKQDEAFGASNPQGFSGGGFAIGGAEARISSVRCAPNCPSPEELGLPADPSNPVGDLPSYSDSPPVSSGASESPALGETSPVSGILDSPSISGAVALPEASPDYSATTAVTPPDLYSTGSAGKGKAAAPSVAQPLALASSPAALGPKEAGWVRDLYLALGAAVGILFVGQRLARAF